MTTGKQQPNGTNIYRRLPSLPSLLAAIEEGNLITDVDEKLEDLVSAVREHNKPGTLAIEIKISSSKKPGRSPHHVSASYKLKAPVADVPEYETSLYINPDENVLQVGNPNQKEMKLESVDDKVEPIVDVSADDDAPLVSVGDD